MYVKKYILNIYMNSNKKNSNNFLRSIVRLVIAINVLVDTLISSNSGKTKLLAVVLIFLI